MSAELMLTAPPQVVFITAMLAGLFGGVHCVGMCGGIVSALNMAISTHSDITTGKRIAILLAYNAGRISTYVVLGAVAGEVGANLGEATMPWYGWQWMRYLAGGLMIAMGLYLGGWWFGLLKLEQLGGKLWQRVRHLGPKLSAITHPFSGYQAGLVWGLLPCGLIYTMLVIAMATGGRVEGATLLFAFGLGTLPVVGGLGLFLVSGRALRVKPVVRSIAAVFVILFGVWTITSTAYMQSNIGLGCAVPTGPFK